MLEQLPLRHHAVALLDEVHDQVEDLGLERLCLARPHDGARRYIDLAIGEGPSLVALGLGGRQHATIYSAFGTPEFSPV